MKERAQELEAAGRRGPRAGKADGERDVLAKIAEMPEPDRAMAERLHAIVKASAPTLTPRTWYGMPAYALDGKVVCFFQSAQKFKTRYATFGFSDAAHLDERRHVADRLRAGEADRRRRGANRRAREEGGELSAGPPWWRAPKGEGGRAPRFMQCVPWPQDVPGGRVHWRVRR